MRATDLTWFKSSYSKSGGHGDCVEVALTWQKSSYSSSGSGENCVEVAACPATVHIRDSKVADGPLLDLGPGAWADFIGWA
ncbi:DUF397 domain-containing protein [Streptomyces sp. NPDC058953]|uniref:DUF397 domain-containing protein n=1 Tax=unclassified Streptomyces TaxID=2593676 RepID=UPI0036AC39A9